MSSRGSLWTIASAVFSSIASSVWLTRMPREDRAVERAESPRFVVEADAGVGIEDRQVHRLLRELAADLREVRADFLALALHLVALGARAGRGKQLLAADRVAAALDQLGNRRQRLAAGVGGKRKVLAGRGLDRLIGR